jgi:predicted enzyme related to lactoylglutathione lyase
MITPQPEEAASFYRKVFGWTVDNTNALGYRAIETGGLPGGIWPSPPGQQGFVQLFISVDDIDGAITEATTEGAKLIVPKSALPDGDTIAILLDPTGMSFGLMQSR